MRQLSKTMKSTMQLVKADENSYSFNTTILFITTSQKFKLGEEKELTTIDGRKIRNIFTIEGNKLIEKQIGEKILLVEREFFDEEMIVKTSSGGVVCTTWCKHVE